MANDEKAPLLPKSNENGPQNYTEGGTSPQPREDNVVASHIGADELPPPYSPFNQGGVPMIHCKVCRSMIDITGKKDQHVVKCSSCNEATPVKSAPPGKKYVRCPCNCLLICKASSLRIACPRPNCKRIINLAASPATPTTVPSAPGMCQVTCGHCNSLFLFNTLHNSLARCPHCRKLSSVGRQFCRTKALIYFLASLVFLAIALGITFGTLDYGMQHKAMIVLYFGVFAVSLIFQIKSIYYCTMKVSTIEGPV